MTTPNHIVGGIAFTGISLSFWDINIFSNSAFIAICIFASILPDIDHVKSIIGKMFFPIAKFIDRRFGHRTITHSLTFFVPIILIFAFFELNFINQLAERSGLAFTMVFGFSMFSHYILDMLTIAGIPLFYPFMKNACVIPANPSMRIKSGNLKQESIVMLIFVMVIFSSYDLFANGFWTSYNRSFGSVMHTAREFNRNSNFTKIDYSFLENSELKKGTGLILEATDYEITFFENSEIKILSNQNPIIKEIDLQPYKTEIPYKIQSKNFNFYSTEEINDFMQGKIVFGEIQASNPFIFDNILIEKSLKLKKTYSPEFESLKNKEFKAEITNEITLLESKLKEIQAKNNKKINELKKLKKALKTAQNKLLETKNLYLKNKFENQIISLKGKISNFNLELNPTELVNKEISILKENLLKEEITYFNGTLEYFELN